MPRLVFDGCLHASECHIKVDLQRFKPRVFPYADHGVEKKLEKTYMFDADFASRGGSPGSFRRASACDERAAEKAEFRVSNWSNFLI
jgi:hypothetical protein